MFCLELWGFGELPPLGGEPNLETCLWTVMVCVRAAPYPGAAWL